MNEKSKSSWDKIISVKNQIKKEHFIKLIFWISTVSLFVFWLAGVLATSIDDGIRIYTYGELNAATTLEDFIFYAKIAGNDVGDYAFFVDNGVNGFKEILTKRANNPMLLVGSQDTMGWFMTILTAPIGFILLLWYISIQKNMITPEAIKKTVRKGLQFNYLKQKDVEYVEIEVDYNTGKKERTEVLDNEKDMREN